MKTFLSAIFTILIFSIPAHYAAASERPGLYLSGFLGTSFFKDISASNYDLNNSTPFDEKIKFDPGVYYGLTSGYDFGFVRLEGELSYRGAAIDSIASQSSNYTVHDADGDLGAYSTMLNVFFDLHNDSRVTPYLGAGVGLATLRLSDTYGYVTSGGAIKSTKYELLYLESDDTVFAWQVGGGLEIELNSRFSLDLGYRYFRTDNAHFDSYYPTTSSMRLESHNAMIGFRTKF